jgi:hypothetical protein
LSSWAQKWSLNSEMSSMKHLAPRSVGK